MKVVGFSTVTRSARTVRLRAALPRVALVLLIGVFCLRGVRATFGPGPLPVATAAKAQPQTDLAARALAERFARVYLTWDPDQPELRDERLDSMVASPLKDGAGMTPPSGVSQTVSWTATVAQSGDRSGSTITVAAQAGARLIHLAVPVARTATGALAIVRAPAVVGPPAIDTEAAAPSNGDEVEDDGLLAVVERSLGNYLGGARANVLADLAPGSYVSLPGERMKLEGVDGVTWAAPDRRVAVDARARDEAGGTWTLHYELGVERRDRWYVRSIGQSSTRDTGVAP